MRSLIRTVRNVWCGLTRRCQISATDDDPLMATLRAHERDARRAARESRERQYHIESAIAGMASDVQRAWARERGDVG